MSRQKTAQKVLTKLQQGCVDSLAGCDREYEGHRAWLFDTFKHNALQQFSSRRIELVCPTSAKKASKTRSRTQDCSAHEVRAPTPTLGMPSRARAAWRCLTPCPPCSAQSSPEKENAQPLDLEAAVAVAVAVAAVPAQPEAPTVCELALPASGGTSGQAADATAQDQTPVARPEPAAPCAEPTAAVAAEQQGAPAPDDVQKTPSAEPAPKATEVPAVPSPASPCPSKEDASPATSDGKRGAAPPPSPVQPQQQQQQKQPRADFSGSTFVAAEAAQQALLAQNLLMLPQPQPQQQQKQKQQRQEAAKAYNEMLVKIAMQRAATLRLDSRLKIETWPSTPSNTTERF